MSTNPQPLRSSALTGWRKSSYSGGNDNCVEITEAPAYDAVAVHDSKIQDGPVLLFSPAQFNAFVRSVRPGR